MKAQDLANYVINKALEDGRPVSNLQLQKILYFVNLYYISLTKIFLLDGEPFEAWQHGPVIPEIYRKYAYYGGATIRFEKEKIISSFFDADNKKVKSDTMQRLDDFISYLTIMDPWTLVDYSHRIGGAWERTYYPKKKNAKIKNGLIKQEALK